MADGATTNHSFVLPEVGGSKDAWGDKLNDNWVKLDGLLASEEVRPELYGAVGDGVTDDTAAMQNWLAAAVSSGLTPALRAGQTYRITAPCGAMADNMRIKGNGATIFMDAPSLNGFNAFSAHGTRAARHVNIGIRDLTVTSANCLDYVLSVSATTGINLENVVTRGPRLMTTWLPDDAPAVLSPVSGSILMPSAAPGGRVNVRLVEDVDLNMDVQVSNCRGYGDTGGWTALTGYSETLGGAQDFTNSDDALSVAQALFSRAGDLPRQRWELTVNSTVGFVEGEKISLTSNTASLQEFFVCFILNATTMIVRAHEGVDDLAGLGLSAITGDTSGANTAVSLVTRGLDGGPSRDAQRYAWVLLGYFRNAVVSGSSVEDDRNGVLAIGGDSNEARDGFISGPMPASELRLANFSARRMSKGGAWSAQLRDSVFSSCYAEHCWDIGLHSEGGRNHLFEACISRNCRFNFAPFTWADHAKFSNCLAEQVDPDTWGLEVFRWFNAAAWGNALGVVELVGCTFRVSRPPLLPSRGYGLIEKQLSGTLVLRECSFENLLIDFEVNNSGSVEMFGCRQKFTYNDASQSGWTAVRVGRQRYADHYSPAHVTIDDHVFEASTARGWLYLSAAAGDWQVGDTISNGAGVTANVATVIWGGVDGTAIALEYNQRSGGDFSDGDNLTSAGGKTATVDTDGVDELVLSLSHIAFVLDVWPGGAIYVRRARDYAGFPSFAVVSAPKVAGTNHYVTLDQNESDGEIRTAITSGVETVRMTVLDQRPSPHNPENNLYWDALPTKGIFEQGSFGRLYDGNDRNLTGWRVKFRGGAYREEWSAATDYGFNDNVKASDGKVYRSTASTGPSGPVAPVDPTTSSNWTSGQDYNIGAFVRSAPLNGVYSSTWIAVAASGPSNGGAVDPEDTNQSAWSLVWSVQSYQAAEFFLVREHEWDYKTGAAFWNLPALNPGDSATITVAVNGAELGDFVILSWLGDLQGLTLTGYVVSDNTVEAVAANHTSGPVDLGGANLSALVIST